MRDNTLIMEVFDLHFAGSAFCEDSSIRGRVQGCLESGAYSLAEVFVFLLHAECAGQAAASCIEVRDVCAAECLQQGQ